MHSAIFARYALNTVHLLKLSGCRGGETCGASEFNVMFASSDHDLGCFIEY